MLQSWQTRILSDGMDRQQWLTARQLVVTASDVANILGLGDKSRASVLRAKLSGDTGSDAVGQLAMVAAGRHLERGVFEWFAAETIHETAEMCGALIHAPDHRWLAATPDALLDGEPVECKVVGFSSRPNWHADTAPVGFGDCHPSPVATNLRFPPENLRTAAKDLETPRGYFRDCCRAAADLVRTFGEVVAPIKYWTQLQVQMHVLDADFGWIVGLHAGTGRTDLYYARDRVFEAWMLQALTVFWNEWQEATDATVRSSECAATADGDARLNVVDRRRA